MYYYVQSEPHLWTVGCDDARGNWHPDSDHSSKEEASKRVILLNGGSVTVQDSRLEKVITFVQSELANTWPKIEAGPDEYNRGYYQALGFVLGVALKYKLEEPK
jgi:hypothetical protein